MKRFIHLIATQPFYRIEKRPRLFGYYWLRSIVAIIDALLTIIASPFGYECNLLGFFGDWHLRWNCERYKIEQAKRKARLKR